MPSPLAQPPLALSILLICMLTVWGPSAKKDLLVKAFTLALPYNGSPALSAIQLAAACKQKMCGLAETDSRGAMQTDINENMRAILIDWLVEVHYKFKVRVPVAALLQSPSSFQCFQIYLFLRSLLCPSHGRGLRHSPA